MVLDRDTTFVVSALITLALGMILLVAQGDGRIGRWAAWWGVGNVAFGLSNISRILVGVVPDACRVVGENLTGLIGYGMIVQGARLFTGRDVRLRSWIAVMLVAGVPLGLAHAPHFKADRIAFNNVLLIVGDLWVALEAARMARRERLNTPWIMVGLFAATVPLSCWRLYATVLALMGLDTLAHVRSGPWTTAMLATIWSLRGAVPALVIAERSARTLERLACRDQLTGALNRSGLDRLRANLVGPVAALMLDLDHFKPLNDRYGHAQGDAVLKMLVSAIDLQLGPRDAVARLGGDEFAVILPGATARDAGRVAERIRAAFAAATAPLGLAAPSPTISIGIVVGDGGPAGMETLLRHADTALYRAKGEGRDRIAA